MEKITHRFSLDVNKNGIQRTIQGIETGEKYAREIRISLRNGKENYEIPSDDSVKAVMYVRKPTDTTPIGYDCEVDGDEVVYTLKHDNVNEAGTTLMQLKLIGVLRSGVQTVLVAPRFAIEVWESDTEEDTSEVETEDFTALETALGKAEAFYDGRVRSVIIDDDYEIIVTFNNDEVYTNDALKGFHSEIEDIASETSETSESLTSMVESTSAALSSEIASATSELAHSTSVYMSTASSELASELDSTASYLGSEIADLDDKKLNKENPVVSGYLGASTIYTSKINAEAAEIDVNAETTFEHAAKFESYVYVNSHKGGYYDVADAFAETFRELKLAGETFAPKDSPEFAKQIEVKGEDGSISSLSGTTLNVLEIRGGNFFDKPNFPNDLTVKQLGSERVGSAILSIRADNERVGSEIVSIKEDIEDLKNRPIASSLILSSSSPLSNSEDKPILGIDVVGKSEQDGTPTPTNPIPIVDASGEVKAHTKNILKPNATESVKSGVTITPIYEDDVLQYVELNGTCTSNATYYVAQGLVLDGGNYVLSGCPAGGSSSTYRLGLNDGTSTYWDIGESKSIVFDSEKTCDVRISMYSGQTYNHLRFYPMIEEGTSASSYVPYQSNTINLPTLRSIGSVADELIVNKDGSGKIVQKVGAVRFSDLTNPTFEGANSRFAFTVNNCKAQAARTLAMLCDIYTAITDGRALASVPNNSVYASGDGTKIYVHDNSTTDVSLLLGNIGDKYIYYPLATPIETPLTAEQVASILALHTYDGTTLVDAELDVKRVEYAGDIKGYVDTAIVDYADDYSANHSPYAVTDTIDIPIRGGIRVDDIYRVTIIYYTSSTLISTYEYYVVVAEENGNLVSRVHNLRTPNDYPRVTFVNNAIRLKFEQTLYGQGIAERLARYRTSGISRMSDVPQTLSLASEVVANE